MKRVFRGFTTIGMTGTMGLLAGAAALMAITSPAAAQGEKSLLGVRIWDSKWKSVLARHGQPTRIEVGAVTSGASQAGGTGGAPGMPGMPGMGGGPGLPGLAGMGMMGSGGGMSIPGMMGSGGGGGKMGVMMGMMGGGGSAGGMPGMPSMPGMPGVGGAPGMPGMGGIPGMGGEGQSAAAEEEVTWVYERKGKSPLTDFFLFNRDGRLIQVGSFGYSGGAVTSRGVKLGDPVGKIYGAYGFTGNLVKDNARSTMTLDYSKEKNVVFQLLDRHNGQGYRIVGITVGLTDKKDIPGNRTDENAE